MEKKIALLARKYAIAFVNVFESSLNIDDIQKIDNAIQMLSACEHLNFFLEIAYIADSLKHDALSNIIIEKAGLHESFNRLIALLIEHKRSSLIVPILKNIEELLMEKKNIEVFTISSSHELQKNDLEALKAFLAEQTKSKIIVQQNIDKKLIAGLRMQSNNYLWEHSIRSFLNRVSSSLLSTKE